MTTLLRPATHAAFALAAISAISCDAPPEDKASFRMHQECPPGCTCVCEDSTGSSSTGSSSTGSSSTGSSSTGSSSTGPVAYDCPDIVDGINVFSGVGLPDRQALVMRYGVGGPLSVHWYGTNNSIVSARPWGSAATTETMVIAEGGIFVMPEADPAALTRPNDVSFPWWVTGNPDAPEEESDRMDDFLLMDAVVGCLAGTYDPARITSGGHSAGAVMSSHLLHERAYLAGAAIWSGGMRYGASMVLANPASAAIILHGGLTDQYCGPGVSSCYEFRGPSEALGADMIVSGGFAFLCDHGEGDTSPIGSHHTDAMASVGTEFLRLAHTDGHPWEGYPFGPSAPNGALWMLDNYCYAVGDASPWD